MSGSREPNSPLYGTGIFFAVLFSFFVWFAVVILGNPPRHCRYLVPMAEHPGVYACSEYPRPEGR